jgi:hypothetical protein
VDGMHRLCIILMEKQIIEVSKTLPSVGADKIANLVQSLCLDIAFFGWLGRFGLCLCLRFSTTFFR